MVGLSACASLRDNIPPGDTAEPAPVASAPAPAPDATAPPAAETTEATSPETDVATPLQPLSGEVLPPAPAARSSAATLPAALSEPNASCLADQGIFQRGTSGTYRCIRPTPDAGKTCASSSECSDVCLARSRSCTPFAPLSGCFEVLGQYGERSTLCRD